MINQELKSRINKLDFNLKEIFENVYIQEKSVGNQFFFKIDVNGEFWNLNESDAYQRAEVKVIIHKTDLLKDPVSWSYSSNPVNETAHYVERVSKLDSLAKDIEDVVINLRMDESYFQELPYVIESIKENTPMKSYDSHAEVIKSELEKLGLPVDDITQEDVIALETNQFMTSKPDRKYSFHHHYDINMSTRFIIEDTINTLPGVNYTVIKKDSVEVHFTPF